MSAQDTIVYNDRSGLSHWVVSDILQDRQGFIWLSTWNGLNRFDGYEFRHITSLSDDGNPTMPAVIRQMKPDPDGNIICKTDQGLFLFDTQTYRFGSLHDEAGDSIVPLTRPAEFTDWQGNRWQVERYGLTKVVKTHHPAQVVEGTESVQARAFLLDNRQRWWLATKEDECVRVYDRENRLLGYLGPDGKLHPEQTPFGYRPYCLMQTRSGDIWMGCKPGALLRLREQGIGQFEVKHLGDLQIYHIAEDPSGRLWIATYGQGVMCVESPNSANPEVVPFPESEGKIRRILITDSGNLVCATNDGLLLGSISQIEIRESRFRLLQREGQQERSLYGLTLTDAVADSQGRIWVATSNSGLIQFANEEALFSNNPEFVFFNTANSALTTDVCQALALKGNGHLLIVGLDRVTDFSPDSDETVTYARNFWNPDSHFSEERPLLLPDSSWLFGQEQGAYIASGHSMESRGYVPPILFTEWSVNGRQPDLSICHQDTITVAPEERNFRLAFAALDYTHNADISYRYRMNGSAWSHSNKDRTLTVFGVRPGEYVLEVQSTDGYGRWVGNTRQLVIRVMPHWYETWWANLSGWLLSMSLVALAVYVVFYVRQLHRQRRELLSKYMTLLAHSESEQESEPAGNVRQQDAENTDNRSWLQDLPDADAMFMNRVMQYIEENIGNCDANIEDMASVAATSRSNLNRRLRSLVGITAGQLLIDARMQRARQILQKKDNIGIAEIAYLCGYSDPHYFSRSFKQKYGVTPTDFQREKS